MFTAEKMLELFNQALVEHKIERKPEGLYDPIRYVLSLGGKRIRPVLMLMAYNLYFPASSSTKHADRCRPTAMPE